MSYRMAGPKNAAFAEESAEVEVLLASLEKTKELTKRITSSMSRLEASGRTVKEALAPIYGNTQHLQITSRNIDRLNEAIEQLRQPLDSRGREENIIRAGPKSAGLQQYLGALKRVDKAVADLSATNLRSNQQAISDFSNLLAKGVAQIHDLYRQTLGEDVATVEPLHFITKGLAFPTIPNEKLAMLSQMASVMQSASAQIARQGQGQRDDDSAGRIYAEVRGDYLQNSLQNLATASISTSKRRGNNDEVYRQGTNGIGAYAQAVEGMFIAEHENTSKIFRNDSNRILTMTCSKSLGTFSRTLSDLNTTIKSRILTDCFLAYEILDLVTPLAYRLEKRTSNFRPQFSDALRPIRDTARASLASLLSQTKSLAEGIVTLPPDGNTVPLVTQTAARLATLAAFDQPLLTLLASIGDGNWRSASTSNNLAAQSSLSLELTPSTENPNLLSHYLLDIVGTLIDTLNARSQVLHRTKPLQGVFLLNTVAILSRRIESTADLQRYIGISPHHSKLEGYRKNASSLYLFAWREPSGFLLDTIYTGGSGGRPMSGQPIDSTTIIKSLSSKDKDKIKEKFKMFNTSFDELVARHKSLHMEKEVKATMSRDIQATIEPLYGRFWDRYHEVDKGKGKVVKYSKSELSALLSTL